MSENGGPPPPVPQNPAAAFTNIMSLSSLDGRLAEIEKAPAMDASPGCEILMHSGDADIDGMLDITLHHASDIHNICIYGNQDVYAKFSITQAQDAVYSTQPVRGGGKNPVFNQSLQILISKPDSVLKCELWMMSCARNYLQDQLLGFVLVPLSGLLGVGKSTCDYSLTSTELFHTPAGTVCLSLSFYKRNAQPLLDNVISKVSKLHASKNGVNVHAITTGKNEKHDNMISKTPVDYNSIEFPDLQIASENQQLVSMYIKMVSGDSNMVDTAGARLDTPEKIGASAEFSDSFTQNGLEDVTQQHPLASVCNANVKWGGDSEMILDNGEQNIEMGSDSHMGVSKTVCVPRDATLQSPHEHVVQANARTEEISNTVKSKVFNSSVCSNSYRVTMSPTSISSCAGLSLSDDKVMGQIDGQESASSSTNLPPPVSISLDPEVPVVQQQIVDMYMKSMQQFTESLSKMKLPFDMDSTSQSLTEHSSESQQLQKNAAVSDPTMKDGHRVFYGSRAFF